MGYETRRIFPAMQIQNKGSLSPRFLSIVCRLFTAPRAVAFVGMLFTLPFQAHAQTVPAEAYGPYNAIFLPDGPGLTKSLAPPSPLDSRSAALLDRLGLNKQADERDSMLNGRATWTLAFWFRSTEIGRAHV